MRDIRHVEIVLLTMVLAFVAHWVPLQKFITLARYQHLAIALYIWAAGFFVQTAVSWRKLRLPGRMALGLAGIYVGGLAAVLYANPWLDNTMSLQTTDQDAFRFELSVFWLFAGVIVGIVWVWWGVQELLDLRKAERALSNRGGEHD